MRVAGSHQRAGPAGSLLALPEQGPCEPAGRPQPADLTLSELDRAGEGRRRTDVHQPGGSRQPDVRRVREREGQGAQLPAACRAAQVTDRLADGGEGRVYAAGRVAPRLPHKRRHQVDEADVAPARRHPGPARAAPRRGPRRRGPRAASSPRHDAVLGSNRASAVQPCCGAVLLIGSSPAYCIPYGNSLLPEMALVQRFGDAATHCHTFGYSIQSSSKRLLIAADRASAESP